MPSPAYPYRSRPAEPDAPECDITVSWNGRSLRVPALIDSGAGVTTIPVSVVSNLGLQQVGEVFLRGAQGPRQKRWIYRITLDFLGNVFVGHPVVALDRDFILLGRDLLNRHRLLLDGPQLSFSID